MEILNLLVPAKMPLRYLLISLSNCSTKSNTNDSSFLIASLVTPAVSFSPPCNNPDVPAVDQKLETALAKSSTSDTPPSLKLNDSNLNGVKARPTFSPKPLLI